MRGSSDDRADEQFLVAMAVALQRRIANRKQNSTEGDAAAGAAATTRSGSDLLSAMELVYQTLSSALEAHKQETQESLRMDRVRSFSDSVPLERYTAVSAPSSATSSPCNSDSDSDLPPASPQRRKKSHTTSVPFEPIRTLPPPVNFTTTPTTATTRVRRSVQRLRKDSWASAADLSAILDEGSQELAGASGGTPTASASAECAATPSIITTTSSCPLSIVAAASPSPSSSSSSTSASSTSSSYNSTRATTIDGTSTSLDSSAVSLRSRRHLRKMRKNSWTHSAADLSAMVNAHFSALAEGTFATPEELKALTPRRAASALGSKSEPDARNVLETVSTCDNAQYPIS
jgi:hypothetical protein